jgi:hypothetical protein
MKDSFNKAHIGIKLEDTDSEIKKGKRVMQIGVHIPLSIPILSHENSMNNVDSIGLCNPLARELGFHVRRQGTCGERF